MADLRAYCPACLDLWATPAKVRPSTQDIIPRPTLPHEACENALRRIYNGND